MTGGTSNAPPQYRRPDARLRPGDVFLLAPVLEALRGPIAIIGSRDQKGGRIRAALLGGPDGAPLPGRFAAGQEPKELLVAGRLCLAVLLTRGCDIDNGDVRQVAPIRPLRLIRGGTGRSDEENQIAVVEGRTASYHFLPRPPECLLPPEVDFPPSFVDLRRTTTLHRSTLDDLPRVVSLTREAVTLLYFAWLRHVTGKQFAAQGICPGCGAAVPFLEDLLEPFTPDHDY